MPTTNSTRRAIAQALAAHIAGGFSARFWASDDNTHIRLYITRGAVAWGHARIDADGDVIVDGVKAGKDRDRVVTALEQAQEAVTAYIAAKREERGDDYVSEWAPAMTCGIYSHAE